MTEFTESRERLISKLKTDPIAGLSTEQSSKNREQYGVNTLTREKAESLLKRIVGAASEPMILMLVMAGIIALVVNIIRAITGGEADFLECVGIFAAISLSVMITVIMEGKSAKAFEALTQISEDTLIKVLRNGDTVMIGQKDIVVGDIVLLSTGDKIPADGRLFESYGLSVDESTLTGESIPAKKEAAYMILDHKTPLAERCNMLYSGNYITSGHCKLIITAVGDNTALGKASQTW